MNTTTNPTPAAREPPVIGVIHSIPLTDIYLIPGNPFQIRDDPEILELIDSVNQFGVLTPAGVHPKEGSEFEMIVGARRQRASALVGLESMPVIILHLGNDDAVIRIVDSNIHRPNSLPSTKATAYRMRMVAMKRKAGRPKKDEKEKSPII